MQDRQLQTLCKRFALAIIGINLVLLAAAGVRAQTVVTSIQPLYLLAKEVLPEELNLQSLLPPGTTPHGFQLAVSQRRLLEDAELVVWIGPTMETFLPAVVRGKNTLQLDQLAQLQWPLITTDDHLPENTSDDHDHPPGRDPHIWLNPENARVIAQAIVAKVKPLVRDAQSQQALVEKLHRFEKRLDQREADWQAQLAPVAQQPWLVYHDAVRHLQQYFSLADYRTITTTPEHRPGAKYLYELRQDLTPGQCLLVEDYYPVVQAKSLAKEFHLKVAKFDPLGADADSYIALMDHVVTQVAQCLSATQQ